jgi:hypothetical protein
LQYFFSLFSIIIEKGAEIPPPFSVFYHGIFTFCHKRPNLRRPYRRKRYNRRTFRFAPTDSFDSFRNRTHSRFCLSIFAKRPQRQSLTQARQVP